MKSGIIFLSLSVLLQSVTATALKVGDNLETTLGKLGKPIGTIELKEKTLLLYPAGEVVLKDEAVVEIDLMSDTEFEAEQERLKAEREEWLVQQSRLAEANTKEGEMILADKSSNSVFATLPAKDRVDYWRRFQARYPSVDASEQLASALDGYETEIAELRSQQQIAQLEARVAKAEQEAATARLETEQLKKEAERTRVSTRYDQRRYYDPVVQPRYIYRPPTVTILTNDNCEPTQNINNKPDYWKFRNYNPNGTAERVARILHIKRNN